MSKKLYILLFFIVFTISLVKSIWNENIISLPNTIKIINTSASRRIPFERKKEFTQIAQKISNFQKKIIGNKVKEVKVQENKIILRQQKIINQLIRKGEIKCNSEKCNFGLTILPSDVQLDIQGSNLPQPNFPLSVTSKGKNTYFQLVISAYEDINNIKIEFVEEQNESIECYLGDYVYCSLSPYFNTNKWYQDPLLPFEKKNNTFEIIRNIKPIKKGDSFPIWVKLNQTTNKLKLNCKLTITGTSESIISTTINVNKSLHKRKNLDITVLNSYYPGWTNYYYQDSNLVEKLKLKNNLFIKKSNLDPTLLYCSEKTGLFPNLSDNTDNKGPIVIYNFKEFKEIYNDTILQTKILKTIRDRELYLSSINQISNSYIYLFDELPEDQNYKLIWISKWLKKNDVKSKLLTTSSYLSGKESIDIWCVLLQNYDKLKNIFDGEMWVYICNSTPPPFPNFLIESNKQDFNKLYNFIELRPKIKGFLYYAINNWRGNMINHEEIFNPISKRSKEILNSRSENIRWPDIEWISYSYKDFNGDGYFFYPHKDGSFIPSSRLFLYQNLLLDLKKNL